MNHRVTHKLALLWVVAISGAGCSMLAGIDKDYREVEPGGDDAGVGGVSGSSGSGGSAATGGVAGTGGGLGGSGGVAGSGGVSGSGGVAGATGGAAGSGGGGGSTACAALGKVCLPLVPTGFLGPVTLSSGATPPPACSADYPTPTVAGGLFYDGLQAPTAACDCTCNTPVGAICSTATLRSYTGLAKCLSGSKKIADLVQGGVCTPVTISGIASWIRAKGNFVSGSCVPQPSKILGTPSWSLQARACGGASFAGACPGGQVCAPATSLNTCVYQAGNLTCPAGYANKQIFYDGFNDSRDCTTCSCGTATGQCDGSGTVSFHNAMDCSDSSLKTISLGSCEKESKGKYAKYNDGPPSNVSCPPSGGVATGNVTPANPVTFCCTN